MPTVSLSYVKYQGRSGRRGHHPSGGPVPFDTSPPVHDAPGDTYGTLAPQQYTLDDGSTVSFAFWSVTGAADGSSISFDRHLHDVSVGNRDVTIKAWFLPAGGPGTPGNPGFFVDAFDVNVGDFVDDDFVTVVGQPAMTATANNDGTVSTVSAETLEAYLGVHDPGNSMASVPFTAWHVFGPPEITSNTELDLTARTSGFAFAFYQTPIATTPHPKNPAASEGEWTWVTPGVMVDGGGLSGNGPVPPWTPDLQQLAAALALIDAANVMQGELRAQAMHLAAKQLLASTNALAGAITSEHRTGAELIAH